MVAAAVMTESQLELLFHNNNSGDISAGDGRNLVSSAFGYAAMSAPSSNNDRVDTAGIGQFFDTGSKWTNVSTSDVYWCIVGTPTAAVWIHIAGPPAPPTPTGVNTCNFLYQTIPPTLSGLFAMIGGTPADGQLVLYAPLLGAASVNAGPWIAHSGAWTRPTWYAHGASFPSEVWVLLNTAPFTLSSDVNKLWFAALDGTPSGPIVVDTTSTRWTPAPAGAIQFSDGNGHFLLNGLTSSAEAIAGNPSFTVSNQTFGPGAVTKGGAGKYVSISTDVYGYVSALSDGDQTVLVTNITGPGTISLTLLPTIPWSQIGPGTIPLSQLPLIPWSGIGPGTIPLSQLPSIPVGSLTGPGTISPGLLPPPGSLNGSFTYVKSVSCSGSSLSVGTGTITVTNGVVTSIT